MTSEKEEEEFNFFGDASFTSSSFIATHLLPQPEPSPSNDTASRTLPSTSANGATNGVECVAENEATNTIVFVAPM